MGTGSASAQTVRGVVVEAQTGARIALADVALMDPAGRILRTVSSDTAGRFALSAPSGGRYVLRAQRLGYRTATTPSFEIPERGNVEQTLRLEVDPLALDPLVVRRRGGLEAGRDGFARRCAIGRGFCFDTDSIRRMGAREASAVFHTVPGLRVHWSTGRPQIESLVGWRCLIVFFNHSLVPLGRVGVGVDLPGDRAAGGGFHVQPFHMNQIDVSQIRGIEIYRSFAELPAEFKEGLYMTYAWPTGRMGGCGFAVMWTDIAW